MGKMKEYTRGRAYNPAEEVEAKASKMEENPIQKNKT